MYLASIFLNQVIIITIMKPRKILSNGLLILGTLFLLASCEPTDLAEPCKEDIIAIGLEEMGFSGSGNFGFDIDKSVSENIGQLEKIKYEGLADRNGMAFAIYHHIDFDVARLARAGSVFPQNFPVQDEELGFAPANPYGEDALVLSGTGHGWSEEFGRSLVETELMFVPKTLELKGIMTCVLFPSQDTVTLMISGGGALREVTEFDGPHRALVVETTLIEAIGEYKGMVLSGTSYLLNATELFDAELEHFSSYLMTIGDLY